MVSRVASDGVRLARPDRIRTRIPATRALVSRVAPSEPPRRLV